MKFFCYCSRTCSLLGWKFSFIGLEAFVVFLSDRKCPLEMEKDPNLMEKLRIIVLSIL